MSNTDPNNEATHAATDADEKQSQLSLDDSQSTEDNESADNSEAEVIEVAEPSAANSQVNGATDDSSPGAMLKAARLAAGVSIEELVGETKLTKSAIDALESNDFALLPKPVYVRGYYKKCAQVLNANEQAIVSAYVAMAGEEKTPEPVAFTVPTAPAGDFSATKRGGGNVFGSGAFILVLGCVVGGLAFWYLNSDQGDSDSTGDDTVLEMSLGEAGEESLSAVVTTTLETGANTSRTESETSSAETEIATVETSAAADASTNESTSESETDEAMATTELAEDDQAESAEPLEDVDAGQSGPTTVVGNGEIAIKFKEACWTDIRDSEGERLLFGLIDAGTEHRIGGEAPYRVLLGNPEGVEMSFKGQPFDLAPHTRANKTAVFSLGG